MEAPELDGSRSMARVRDQDRTWDFARELRSLRDSCARFKGEEVQAVRRSNEEVERSLLRRQLDETAAWQDFLGNFNSSIDVRLESMHSETNRRLEMLDNRLVRVEEFAMALKLLCLAVISATASAEDAPKVKVEFFAEAGCPFCRQAIAGPVNKTLSTPSVAAIMDFEFYPFGNAYFVTSECKGAGEYDMTARKCFNKNCGAGASQPAKDCFTGALVCQHGSQECDANRYMACAKQVAGEHVLQFMSFAHCVEAKYDTFSKETVSACADANQIDKAAVSHCFSGSEGDSAVIAQAKATPEHPGVPYLVVNGQPVDQPDNLLRTVCEAYKGTRPDACKMAAQEVPHPIVLQA